MAGSSSYDLKNFQRGELSLSVAQPRINFKLDWDAVLPSNFDSVLELVEGASVVSFDTETTGLDFSFSEVVGFSFKVPNSKAYYCFTKHSNSKVVLDSERVTRLLSVILSRKMIYLFNSRFDLRMVGVNYPSVAESINYSGVVDVQSLVFLIDTNVHLPSLKMSSIVFLGIEQPHFEDVVGGDILSTDPARLAFYGAFDAYTTFALGEKLYPVLYQRYPFIVNLDRMIIKPVLDMEDSVFDIDRGYFLGLKNTLLSRMDQLISELDKLMPMVNINSTMQVREFLISKGYDTGCRTNPSKTFPGGQMSVGESALRSLSTVPAVALLLEYRKLKKELSTYVEPFIQRIEFSLPIRFHYILNNAPTYRLASGSFGSKKKGEKNLGYFLAMNFQSLPKPHSLNRSVWWNGDSLSLVDDSEGLDLSGDGYEKFDVEGKDSHLSVRHGFIPPSDEWLWVTADYSGQELRIAANLSQEPIWVDAFLHGRDVHRATAEMVWGKENYNKDYRKKAKVVSFAILYGGSAFTLMDRLGLSQQNAEEVYNQYRQSLPKLFQWIDLQVREGRRRGYVINAYGLPRRLSYFYRQGGKIKGFADRTAVNTVIQSAGAIMTRIAIVNVFKLLGGKYKGAVKFRGTIHDEVNFVVREDVLLAFMQDLNAIMVKTTPSDWVVPMEASFEVGNSWGGTVPFILDKEGIKPEAL